MIAPGEKFSFQQAKVLKQQSGFPKQEDLRVESVSHEDGERSNKSHSFVPQDVQMIKQMKKNVSRELYCFVPKVTSYYLLTL